MKLVALAAVALVFAASAGAGTASQTGVLKGVVTRGAGCSTPHPCSVLSGVTIVFLRHGHAVGQTTSSDVGTYRIRLRAGRYGIRLPGRDQWQPVRVRVWLGRVTRVDIAVGALTR